MNNWSALPTFGNINTHLVSNSFLNILTTIDEALKRISPRSAPVTSEQTSPFFRLPYEMRQAIYEAAMLDDTEYAPVSDASVRKSISINLLQTCRQVKTEAEPIRYQRPQSFSSQAKLFHWVDRSQETNLNRVRMVTLHLTDVDLSTLLDPMVASPQRFQTAWSVYRNELERLEDALRSLSNLSSMTVIPPKDNQSMLLREFYRLFLAMIPMQCPKLKRLALHDRKGVLVYVPTLSNIPEVVFTEHQDEDTDAGAEEDERDVAVAVASPAIKVDSAVGIRRTLRSPLSPKIKRRSRVTHVVSD